MKARSIDLTFASIDADKTGYDDYFKSTLGPKAGD